MELARHPPRPLKRVNPITYIDSQDPPVLILHGSKDPVVPSNQSSVLHAALVAANVTASIEVIERAGHGGPEFSTPEIQAKTQSFLRTTFGIDSPD